MTEVLKEVVMIEGLTVSNIIWRKFRRQPEGFMEKVLDLNPGLSDLVVVPLGAEITFPIGELSEKKLTSGNVVRLWD